MDIIGASKYRNGPNGLVGKYRNDCNGEKGYGEYTVVVFFVNDVRTVRAFYITLYNLVGARVWDGYWI